MREPPTDLSDAEVLALVREHWSADVDEVEHLPVGFGAHHWRGLDRGRPAYFVTYDVLAGSPHHTAASLEAAYVAAAELAFRLDVVVAGLPSHGLAYTVAVASGALSVTPWVHGERPDDDPVTTRATLGLLERLHATSPPSGLRRWAPAPVVKLDLRGPWEAGPLGPEAHLLLRRHADDVRRWAARHRRLAEAATSAEARPWVVTHGEPHIRNQLRTPVRTLLVDWESVRLAPRERDLVHLSHPGPRADPGMLELFELDGRLDEIGQYAARFAGPHPGGADDRVALDGLRRALEP